MKRARHSTYLELGIRTKLARHRYLVRQVIVTVTISLSRIELCAYGRERVCGVPGPVRAYPAAVDFEPINRLSRCDLVQTRLGQAEMFGN